VCARVALPAAKESPDELRSTEARPDASAGPSTSPLGVIVKPARQSQATTKVEWYFVHSLAALTIFEVALLAALNVYFPVGKPPGVTMPLGLAFGIGGFASLWFWVRMLSDFFRERPPSHQAAWGWFLFLGLYVGAVVYFFCVWRPRHRVNDT